MEKEISTTQVFAVLVHYESTLIDNREGRRESEFKLLRIWQAEIPTSIFEIMQENECELFIDDTLEGLKKYVSPTSKLGKKRNDDQKILDWLENVAEDHELEYGPVGEYFGRPVVISHVWSIAVSTSC